jgi:outer membrane receptor protein involved in Fe transport
LPGVTLNDEQGNAAQQDLAIRGFQVTSVTGVPQGISVFLDGVRINEPTVEEVNFDLIPLDDVERIEVIRGPSVLYGRNTLGAAVNIITRRGGPALEIMPEFSGGSFGFQKYRAQVGGTEGPIDYYASGTYSWEDGWRDASAVRLGRAFGKLGYRRGGTDAILSFQYVTRLGRLTVLGQVLCWHQDPQNVLTAVALGKQLFDELEQTLQRVPSYRTHLLSDGDGSLCERKPFCFRP